MPMRVWEPDPPEGEEAVEWVLWTSVPTQSVEEACQRVQWYRAWLCGGRLSSVSEDGLSPRAAPPADLRGLKPLVGVPGSSGCAALATASPCSSVSRCCGQGSLAR